MSAILYRHFDKNGVLLYVGLSNSLWARTYSHQNISSWFLEVASITLEHYESRKDGLKAERQAIENEGPKYNVLHNKEPAPRPIKKHVVAKPHRQIDALMEVFSIEEEKIAMYLGLKNHDVFILRKNGSKLPDHCVRNIKLFRNVSVAELRNVARHSWKST